MIKKIKIKTLFLSIVIIEITLMFLLVYFSYALSKTKERLNKFETNRFHIYQITDAIMHTSDNLSNLAKFYVTTKKTIYKNNYFSVLNIQKNNPINLNYYQNLYADSSGFIYTDTLFTNPILSLKDILLHTEHGFIEAEKLDRIYILSNRLINLELKAMAITDQPFKKYIYYKPKQQNNYTQEASLNLLYSAEYISLKEEVTNLISETINIASSHISADISNTKQIYRRYMYHFQAIIFLFILLNIFALFVLHKRVINIIQYITNGIKMSKKNESKIQLVYTDELGMLIDEFNSMQTLIKSKTKVLEHTNEVLFEQHNMIDKYVMISETDLLGRINYVSQAFCHISGYSQEELLGNTHRILRHKDTPKQLYKGMWNTIFDNKTWKGQIKNVNKSGDEFWIDLTIEPIYTHFGDKIGYRSITLDITDKKRIKELSVKDKLTNLYNRVKLDEVFKYELNQSKRYAYDFAVIIIDIDKFKLVNDTYGHQTGDEVLKKFSYLLKTNIRAADTVGRWGGEEFLILCPKTNASNAKKIAEKLRKIFEEYKHDKVGVKTASFGVTAYQEGDTKEKMINRADMALYEAKNTGRNKVVVYNEKE